MNAPHELRWSDIWFLVSLYFCSLREQGCLRDVIAAADAINHSVMNFEEISSALVRLEEHGLISVHANPWRASCTPKGNAIVEPIAKQNSLARRVWQEVEKKLNVQPWVPKEPLPHPANSLRYPGFTNEDHEKEVAAYLKAMRAK
jgi:hypothetical protein